MLRGLWKLTWIEMKIFVREPLGLFGTLGMPVIVFLIIIFPVIIVMVELMLR